MLRWLMRRRLAAFERDWDYDTSYLRDILSASPLALVRFARIQAMARHREDLPREAWHAAKIAATLAEDCGPCTQLAVTMAEREGVAPAVLRGVLSGDAQAMGHDAALGFRFARAVLARDPQADDLREGIARRWGMRAVVSLAFAVASARVFPTVKYALGHGRACVRVRVGGADTQIPSARQLVEAS